MSTVRSNPSRAQRIALLAVASAAFVGVGLWQAWTDGPTVDEATHIVSGWTVLTRHDLRVSAQHPPLAKIVAVLPLLAANPNVPRDRAWRRHDDRALTAEWVKQLHRDGRLQSVFFLARLLPVIEAAAVAWLMASLAGRLFGPRAGLFAAALWLVNPFTLGVGHLDGIDVPGTLTVLLVALAVLAARRDGRTVRLVLVGLAAGISVVTRTTGLLAVAAAVAAVVIPARHLGISRALRRGAVVVGVAWLTLAATYGILAPGVLAPGRGRWGVLGSLGRLAVPPDWQRGMAHLLRVGSKPGTAFLLGRAHTGRWLLFWPGSMLVKLPPGTALAVLVAPLVCWRLSRSVRRSALVVLGLPAALLGLFTLQQQRPIGLRYLLPSIALGLVATSALMEQVSARARTAIWVVVGGSALLSAAIVPSLSWTLPGLGAGPEVAADSNLDWGQSLPSLEHWSATHHPWLVYFGASGLDAGAIPGARALLGAPAGLTGWVTASASDLTIYQRGHLSWLRSYCPVGVLDHTIVLYRFRHPPDRSRHGPDGPRSCRRSFSDQ